MFTVITRAIALDFELVTSTVIRDLDAAGIQYAVIGGFALGFWGVSRATIDVDLLLLIDDAAQAERILTQHGYRRVFRTENVAQYVAARTSFGGIDIIFAFREVSRKMLQRSTTVELPGGQRIRSLIPEDIIGLKLQALVNDPSREKRDLADIEALLEARRRRGEAIDWDSLEEYFELFDKAGMLAELRGKHGAD